MLLAIDVGNTETVVGMFQGETLTWHWRYSTVGARTADELALLLGGFLEQQGLKRLIGVHVQRNHNIPGERTGKEDRCRGKSGDHTRRNGNHCASGRDA